MINVASLNPASTLSACTCHSTRMDAIQRLWPRRGVPRPCPDIQAWLLCISNDDTTCTSTGTVVKRTFLPIAVRFKCAADAVTYGPSTNGRSVHRTPDDVQMAAGPALRSSICGDTGDRPRAFCDAGDLCLQSACRGRAPRIPGPDPALHESTPSHGLLKIAGG
ncbi:hypothetical protein FKP32DRAFT_1226176 [Trametes sanguinea]|nr:hypothetical protein FKP32DRAFT_1226176 [Trametes sanguinea]